jgi:hypothetical protein
MNSPILALSQIERILEDASAWERQGQLSAYATIMILLGQLREHLETLDATDVGYATEKIGEAEWHVGAMFGLDTDNGHPATAHHASALGALDVLKGLLREDP